MKHAQTENLTFYTNTSTHSALAEVIGHTAYIENHDLSIALTQLEKDGIVLPHFHQKSIEIYIFIEGECTMIIDDKKVIAKKGDTIYIEKNEVHEILPCPTAVSFYAISLPAYVQEDFILTKESNK